MWLFNLYSWITNIGWALVDLLPQPLRKIIFKFTLEEYGIRGGYDD